MEKSDELDEFDEVAYERHGRLDRDEEEKEVEGADERSLRRTSLPRRTVGGEGERNILLDNTRGGKFLLVRSLSEGEETFTCTVSNLLCILQYFC